MALTLQATKALFSRGEYGAIIAQSDLNRPSLQSLSSKHRLLIAQAAFQAGNIPVAADIVRREYALSPPPELRARCEALLGLIERRHGNWDAAQKHFHVSLQYAKEARHARQIGWSYIWLFRTLAELGPADRAAGMLAEVRAAVTRAGDTHLSAYMHDSIALMEASAGRLQEARRHLRIGASMLERFPNAWLQQRWFLSSSFLDFLDCRYEAALANLRHARELADVAGDGLLPIIECNEAHALTVTGDFAAAERRLRKVATIDSPQIALGALEGLARLYLVTDQLTQCAQTLADCASLAANLRISSAFAGRWSSATHLKLFLRRGECAEAATAVDGYLQTGRELDDKVLCAVLSFLKAEALAGIGDVATAVAILLRFGATDAIADSGLQSSYYRALGTVLLRSGAHLSEAMFTRFLAICTAQENRSGILELQHFTNARAALQERREQRDDSEVRIVDSLAAAFNVAHNPILLGNELLSAVEALTSSTEAKLIRQRSHRVAHTADPWRLELGEHRGQTVSLICREPRDPLKAVALAAVLRIGRAALALEQAREEQRNRTALWPASPVEEEAGALFTSDEMQQLLTTVRRVAATNVSVLLTGETGTGKEVLARTIHGYSNRAKGPFLPFNCTSTPRDMLDSQLFGHRRGAFTGATENFPGVIRAAAGGTLFLDEIGDMPLDMQPKLLRFLESNEVHPIGETQPVRVDVRVVAATNADLDTLVADGRFRADLFYRLNIVRLHLPPLRERRMEIPALAQHYLQKYAQEYGKGDLRLAEETMEYLLLYRWPGNIRQLANEMRRMAALSESSAVLMPEHLSLDIAASRRTVPPSERILDLNEVVVRLDQPLAAATEHLERAMLLYALKQCRGRIEETASLLGVSRKGLYLKRQRFGIEPPETPSPMGTS
jgi:DNA-binding NtrC family response regulator